MADRHLMAAKVLLRGAHPKNTKHEVVLAVGWVLKKWSFPRIGRLKFSIP
jgi:hypothetical protein